MCDCTSLRRVPLDSYLPSSTIDRLGSEEHPIVGYTTQDGTYHEFHGHIVYLSADSLRFVPEMTSRKPSGVPAPKGGATKTGQGFDAARSEVQTVFINKGDPAKTIAVTAGITSALLVAFGISLAATWD
jgi:hypothetical protein